MDASEDAVLGLVRNSIKSAWSLELLLLLQREPQRRWTVDALVRELRGSLSLVAESINQLNAAGLVANAGAYYHYAPRSRDLDEIVSALVDLYGHKPVAVLRTIFTAPSDKIRSFSDAFVFKRKQDDQL